MFFWGWGEGGGPGHQTNSVGRVCLLRMRQGDQVDLLTILLTSLCLKLECHQWLLRGLGRWCLGAQADSLGHRLSTTGNRTREHGELHN